MSDKRKSTPPRLRREQSAEVIGEVFDTNEKTVRRWAADGCPHRRDKAKKLWFNDGEVRAWLEAEGRSAKPGRPPKEKPGVPEDLGGDKDYWLARKYRNQCLVDEGELVNRSEYRGHWMQEVQTIKNKCRGLGAAVAPACVGMEAGEIQSLIDARVEQIFRELSE